MMPAMAPVGRLPLPPPPPLPPLLSLLLLDGGGGEAAAVRAKNGTLVAACPAHACPGVGTREGERTRPSTRNHRSQSELTGRGHRRRRRGRRGGRRHVALDVEEPGQAVQRGRGGADQQARHVGAAAGHEHGAAAVVLQDRVQRRLRGASAVRRACVWTSGRGHRGGAGAQLYVSSHT